MFAGTHRDTMEQEGIRTVYVFNWQMQLDLFIIDIHSDAFAF